MTKPKKGDKQKRKQDTDKQALKKSKLVRDGFTMPQHEYERIAEIKDRCLKRGFHAKKSEILRAGLLVLTSMTDSRLEQTLGRVERVKTGRPPKQR
jgi:hypothetical protein